MPPPGTKYDAAARKKDQERRAPKQPGFKLEGRLQQYEIAIAADQEGANLIVAVACLKPLADKNAQIAGEVGVGFVDQFVLANQAAQLRRKRACSCFKPWVRHDFVGLNRPRGKRRQQKQTGQCSNARKIIEFIPPVAGAALAPCGRGARFRP